MVTQTNKEGHSVKEPGPEDSRPASVQEVQLVALACVRSDHWLMRAKPCRKDDGITTLNKQAVLEPLEGAKHLDAELLLFEVARTRLGQLGLALMDLVSIPKMAHSTSAKPTL